MTPAAPPCALCDRPVLSRGLCHTHHERWRRWGKPPLAAWVDAFRAGRLNACEICRLEFNGYFGQKYCTDCDLIRRRRDALARYHALLPAEKRAAVGRALAAGRARRRAGMAERTCKTCGTPFPGFPRRVFCSPACRRADTTARQREIRSRKQAIRSLDDARKLDDTLDDRRPAGD